MMAVYWLGEAAANGDERAIFRFQGGTNVQGSQCAVLAERRPVRRIPDGEFSGDIPGLEPNRENVHHDPVTLGTGTDISLFAEPGVGVHRDA